MAGTSKRPKRVSGMWNSINSLREDFLGCEDIRLADPFPGLYAIKRQGSAMVYKYMERGGDDIVRTPNFLRI